MSQKAGNHHLNLLLTGVIAVLILFLIFKDNINMEQFSFTQTSSAETNTPPVPAAIPQALPKTNKSVSKKQLTSSDSVTAQLQEQIASLKLELARADAAQLQLDQQMQQQQLLSEQLSEQLDTEKQLAQEQLDARAAAEEAIVALNDTVSEQLDRIEAMRKKRDKTGLDTLTLETQLDEKKKELVRSKSKLLRSEEELARKDRIIARKNVEIVSVKQVLAGLSPE